MLCVGHGSQVSLHPVTLDHLTNGELPCCLGQFTVWLRPIVAFLCYTSSQPHSSMLLHGIVAGHPLHHCFLRGMQCGAELVSRTQISFLAAS